MKLLSFIQALEGKSSKARLNQLKNWLSEWHIPFRLQPYATGVNLIIDSPVKPYIGIGTHFDVVPNCPGANDNASSMAVAIGLLDHYRQNMLANIGLTFFFFDEEEKGLIGSEAYVKAEGIKDMLGLINLEMVGMGDRLAIWPLNEQSGGKLLRTIEIEASNLNIPSQRFDKIIMNTADHRSFRDAGLREAFTITVISEKDQRVAEHYYKALEFDVDYTTLWEIISGAPIFEHYHQPTDYSQHLKEDALQMVAIVIWEALLLYDRQF